MEPTRQNVTDDMSRKSIRGYHGWCGGSRSRRTAEVNLVDDTESCRPSAASGRMSEGTGSGVSAKHAGHDTLNPESSGPNLDRLHGGVGGVQADPAPVAPVPLERGLPPV